MMRTDRLLLTSRTDMYDRVNEGAMSVDQGVVSMLCVLSILLCGPGVHCDSHVCDETCQLQDLLCNNNGCIHPSKSFANIGEELVLNCTVRDLHYSNSSMLYFIIGNDVNMSSGYQRVISPNVLELRVPVVDKSLNEVTVGCVAGGVTGALWTSRVRIDYPLREVTNLQVVVHDWRNINISWHMVDYIYTPIVNTSWTILDTAASWKTCDDSGVTWCFLDSYHEDVIYNISVHITSTNGREHVAVSSTFNFTSRDYVQPAAVSEVKVIRVDSRCVELRWTHSHSHSRNLTYRLSLHSTNKEHREKTDQLTSQRTSERVCGLRTDTEYRVGVSVRPTRGGLWSETQSVNFTTLQDYPEEGAMTTDGGFVEEECTEDVRTVYVFLVSPDEIYWNGELTNYKLVYVPSDASSNKSATAEITSVSHEVQLKCHLDYNVYISVYNKIGGSPPSLLHIPRQDKEFGKHTIVLEKNNTEYEMVLEDHTSPLTLFWCRGTSSICQEGLSWRLVDRPHLRLPIDYDSSYIYGLAVKSYTGSSGISWVHCIVDVDKDPARPLPPSVESRPNHGLTVNWRLDRCPVSDYTIQYCTSDLQQCHATMLASDCSEYVIRGLEGGANYSVRVRQRTVTGRQGPYSQPVFAVTRGLTQSELTGLAVGLSLGAIILLCFLLCCVRRVWWNYHRKETITLPKISQEYGEQVDTSTTQDCNSPPALPARVLPPVEQRSGDGQSSGRPDSGLRETIDLTGSTTEVEAPDWGGWVFTDLVESDSKVDPYVTANEDDHHIDDNVCDSNTWANTNCATSD